MELLGEDWFQGLWRSSVDAGSVARWHSRSQDVEADDRGLLRWGEGRGAAKGTITATSEEEALQPCLPWLDSDNY